MEDAEEQYPFLLNCFCNDTLLGIQIPSWFNSQSLADIVLLMVPHGHMCKFLNMGEEFIFMRKIFLMPEKFLAFFGLVGI